MADRFGNPYPRPQHSDPSAPGYVPIGQPPPPAPPPPAEPPPAGNIPYAENPEEYIIKNLASRPWVPEPASPTGIGPQPTPPSFGEDREYHYARFAPTDPPLYGYVPPAPDTIQAMLAASLEKPAWALDRGGYKTHPLDPGTYDPFEGFTGPKTLAEANPGSRPVPGLTPEFEEYLQESGYTIDKRPLVADANPNIYNPQGQKVSMKDWGSYPAPAPRPDVPQLLGVPGQQVQSALASNRPAPDAIRAMLAASQEKPSWALQGRRT